MPCSKTGIIKISWMFQTSPSAEENIKFFFRMTHWWEMFFCLLGCVLLPIWFSTCLHIIFLFALFLCYVCIIAYFFPICSYLNEKLCSVCYLLWYGVGKLSHTHLNWNHFAPFSGLMWTCVSHPSRCTLRVHREAVVAVVMMVNGYLERLGSADVPLVAWGFPTLFCYGLVSLLLAFTTFLRRQRRKILRFDFIVSCLSLAPDRQFIFPGIPSLLFSRSI